MFSTLANWLFGCSHRRTSFPMTRRTGLRAEGQGKAPRSETYVVCLDCGRRFAYDWSEMRIAKPPEAPVGGAPAQHIYRKRRALPAAHRFFHRLVHHT
jgi:hypothetical protein